MLLWLLLLLRPQHPLLRSLLQWRHRLLLEACCSSWCCLRHTSAADSTTVAMATDARATAAVVVLALQLHLAYSCWCRWHHHRHVATRGSDWVTHHCRVLLLLLHCHLLLLLHLHLVMHSWP
jgi:hypothetical protein